MPVEKIDDEQLKAVSKSLNINLSDDQIAEYKELVNGTLQAYDLVDGLENFLPISKYPRDKGRPPSDKENPNNAWYWLTDIKGSEKGILKGKSVAFKDNKEVGVSAQEVEKVLPEVVTEAPIVKAHSLTEDYKSVYYDKLIPLIIEAIKELEQEVCKCKCKKGK